MAHLLPVERMYENLKSSKDVINSHAQLIPGYESTAIDNYTDSIMLNEAVCKVDVPLIEKVIYNYQINYYRQYDQQENLLRYLDGESGYKYQGYTHYWGGHQIILKPLLLLFDYADILILNTILQTSLFILVITGLCLTGKHYVVLPFFVAFMTIMPMAIAVCLQFSNILYIALVGAAFIAWKYTWIKKERMYFLFLVLGILTSYFDFLTYPLVSLGIPIVLFLIYMEKEKWVTQVFYVIQVSVLWCVGYLGMWSGKWILGSIFLPEADSMKVALESIAYRGSNRAEDGVITVFDVLIKNMYVYLKWPSILLIGGVGICFLGILIYRKKYSKRELLSSIPYLLICMYPIIWYLMAGNHSYEHSFMAYRELSIATFAGLSMLVVLGKKEDGLIGG